MSTPNPASLQLLRTLLKLPPGQLSSIRICDLSRQTQIHRNTLRRHLRCLQANDLIDICRDGGAHALCIEVNVKKAKELCD